MGRAGALTQVRLGYVVTGDPFGRRYASPRLASARMARASSAAAHGQVALPPSYYYFSATFLLRGRYHT